MKNWYIVKKKTEKRWTAFELDPENLPELKAGYEMRGPYDSLTKAFGQSFLSPDPIK